MMSDQEIQAVLKDLQERPRIHVEYEDSIDELHDRAADAIETLIGRVSAFPRMISVMEQLPKKAGYYITAFSKGKVGPNLYMLFADGSGKWYQNSEDTGKVTHWMPLPLPELPEEKK